MVDVPPHTLAQSITFPSQSQSPLGIPSPPHTPHSSNTAVPPQSPLQSGTQSLDESLSQVPQLSTTLSQLGTPAQSSHELLSPPQTLQTSS